MVGGAVRPARGPVGVVVSWDEQPSPSSRRPRKGWDRVRRRVLRRDGHECQIRGPQCLVAATEVDHIVNVASTAGKTPVPGGLSYCGTKAAVIALTETARVEYAGSGVEFTCVMPHFTNTELIAGTTSTRLMPVVEPDDVAAAIVDAVRDPQPDVFVPKLIGPMLGTMPLLGRTLRDFLSRKLGAYDSFLDIDQSARAGYNRRIDGDPS